MKNKDSAILCGEYAAMIDDKRRFRIPPQMKNVLNDIESFYLSRSKVSALCILPEEKIQTKIKEIHQIADTEEREKIESAFWGGLVQVNMDNQGRISIPEEFYISSGLQKDIVFVGVVDRIEIWDKAKREEFLKRNPISLI